MGDKKIESLERSEPLTGLYDISKKKVRFVVLGLSSFLCFGSYFIYDNPSALQKLDINNFEFNMLYSIYSFPNVVLPLIGGYLVDFVGVRMCIFIFSCLVCGGQVIFAIGVSASSYWMALLGRAVFGIGGESLGVSKWFKGKEVAMALGLNVSISRLGSVLNDWIEPAMYEGTGSVVLGLWLGVIICGISLGLGLGLCYFDRKRDVMLGIHNKKTDDIDKVKFSDILSFKLSYWLIVVNCFVVYICVMPFNNIASAFYQDRFGYGASEAGFIISITYIIAAILAPICGALVDRIGKRAILILVSAVIVTLVHLSFLMMPDCDKCGYPIVPLGFMGLGYSIYAAVMWASIPYIVEPKTVGTAFGLATALQNLGLAVAPMVVGAIHDSEGDYTGVSLFFVIVGGIGIGSAIWLNLLDKRTGGVLNSSDKRLYYLLSALTNNILETPRIGQSTDEDLPDVVKAWRSDPQSQRSVRLSQLRRSQIAH